MNRKKDAYNQFKKDHCEACGGNWPALDVDHIKTFASGGPDAPHNCMTLCRLCHIEKGRIAISGMIKKYPNYLNFLVVNGWELDKLTGKWVNEKNFKSGETK